MSPPELFHDWNSGPQRDGTYLCLDTVRDGGEYGLGEPIIFGDSEIAAHGRVIGRKGGLWIVRRDSEPFSLSPKEGEPG